MSDADGGIDVYAALMLLGLLNNGRSASTWIALVLLLFGCYALIFRGASGTEMHVEGVDSNVRVEQIR